LLSGVLDVGPQLAQAVDQIADRPLVHARYATEREVPTGQRQRRSQ
jgi:hypothetical protein